MDDINEIYKTLTKYLENHNNDIVIINNRIFSLTEYPLCLLQGAGKCFRRL